MQLEQPESLTCTDTPLTLVASHLLLLETVLPKLQEYAPTYSALIAPPYEFAPYDDLLELLTALQLEQPESLTCTNTPLTLVASHLLLLLEAVLPKLQEYAPTYSTLIAPPYEFAPYDDLPELLSAMQLEQPESLICTNTPLTLVASHLLLLEAVLPKLQEYAPTYSTLIAPPYEFAPKESSMELLSDMQLEQPESLTCTDTPLTLVASHLLLLEAVLLELQEYAPTYSTLIAPPYEFAPYDDLPELLTALQLEQPESLTCTNTPLTLVASHLLLLEAVLPKLQEYAPTYSTLIAPPYEFAPYDVLPELLTAMQLEQPESLTCTNIPLPLVASHLLLLEAVLLELQEYAPTYSALIAPLYEFAPTDSPTELLTALQLEQPESLTCTDTPLTLVASHLLLLEAVLLELQEYAPTYSALIAPLYEFAPTDSPTELLTALQLEQPESLTCTDTPLTLVASHLLLLAFVLLLQAYAPTYNTLIAPPYEFAPRDCASLEIGSELTCVIAVQSTDAACRTRTSTPITSVAPHVLLLLLLLAWLRLQA
jgi:hypothetical protein